MRILFIVFLLFGFFGTANVFGWNPHERAAMGPSVLVPSVPTFSQRPVHQTYWMPQFQMVPYDYSESRMTFRQPHTPLRTLFHLRPLAPVPELQHIYRPRVPQ